MEVPTYAWVITVAVTVVILAIDVFVIGRRPHEPSMKECSIFIAVFVGMAVAFGLGVWAFSGPQYAGEFFAGWLTEYSLSVDNLFIFLLIMAKLAVPRHLQQFALLIGIVLALVFRGIFIALGAVIIDRFAAAFFLFGAFLIYTAVKMVIDYRQHDEEEGATDNFVLRQVRKRLPTTKSFHGTQLLVRRSETPADDVVQLGPSGVAIVEENPTRRAGRFLITPMLFVIIALGTTDLMFALDSIPAIFGLTQEPYLVFAANVFALMGLRQLYFLLGNLLLRLVYLSLGLSVVLAFIGVKLIMHALHTTPVLSWFGIDPHVVPEVPIWLSLGFLVVTLTITTIASLIKSKNDELTVKDPVQDPAPDAGRIDGADDDAAAPAGGAGGHAAAEDGAGAEPVHDRDYR